MFPNAAKQVMLEALAGVITHVSVHDAYNRTGADELAVTRQAITFGDFANGAIPYGNAPIVPDVPATKTARFWGYWGASTSGTFYGMFPNGSEGLIAVAAVASSEAFHAEDHGLTNGKTVVFFGSSLPTGITEGQTYYVVNAATDTFQVSATQGGSAVDLSDEGYGAVSKIVEETFGAQGSLSLTSGSLDANLLDL